MKAQSRKYKPLHRAPLRAFRPSLGLRATEVVHAQGMRTLVVQHEARLKAASNKAVAKDQVASLKARIPAEQRGERRPIATGSATPAPMDSMQGLLDGVGVQAFLLAVGLE